MSIWDKCSTYGCKNNRRHPAAACDACLVELYGYGNKTPGDNGRLVEPAKTLTHLPEMLEDTSHEMSPQKHFEIQMRMKIAELTERVLLAERTFESYKRQPLDTVPKEFENLQPFVADASIPAGKVMPVRINPFNEEGGIPRYCLIHADDGIGNTKFLRLGAVMIHGSPQMEVSDCKCNHFVSTKFYDLQYGAPVNWARIAYAYEIELWLKNQNMMQVNVHIEVWCDTTPHDAQGIWQLSYLTGHPHWPGRQIGMPKKIGR